MANTTLNSIVLHNGSDKVITENHCGKESNLVPQPLYGYDSDQTDVFDFGGAIKTITLSGFYIAEDVEDQFSFIDSIEALAPGKQDSPIELVDDLRGTINVKVNSVNTDKTSGEPSRITWEIKLINSSTYG
jgi:hypothetical protein